MHEEVHLFVQYASSKPDANLPMAGISYCDRTYRMVRSDYDHYVIEHCIGGLGVLEVDGERYEIKSGDTYILYKGKGHRYYCQGDSWTKIWMVLDGTVVDALFREYLKERPNVLHGLHIREIMDHCMDLIRDEKLSYSAVCDQVLLEVHRILIEAKSCRETEQHSLEEQVRSYLDASLYRPFSLQEMARHFHYSKNHIILQFRKKYGCTPFAYYEEQKLQIARELLVGSSESIEKIAERLGFETQHYFAKRFKKRWGMTPAQSRKTGR